ncbi:MAG: lysophospholipid acyltransferase family protein [Hellea sp.]|nr:lysophospholipid acyltransferase family protein [Hellea sp.]
MFKRFMRSSAVQKFLGFILALYMGFVKITTRWTHERAELADPVFESGKGFIGLVWHSRFLMLNSLWKKDKQFPHVLISLSRDGALVAHTAHFIGAKTIRGSARKAGSTKDKGGSAAMKKMIAAIEENDCVVMTPDGPRGPRQRMRTGPIRLARASNAPIITCAMSTRFRKQFNSWDRFVLPLPFGRGVIIWGTPVLVPADTSDMDLEKYRMQVETEMNELLAKADEAMGHIAVEPA